MVPAPAKHWKPQGEPAERDIVRRRLPVEHLDALQALHFFLGEAVFAPDMKFIQKLWLLVSRSSATAKSRPH